MIQICISQQKKVLISFSTLHSMTCRSTDIIPMKEKTVKFTLKEPHHKKSARYSDLVMGQTIQGLIPNNDKKFFPSPKCPSPTLEPTHPSNECIRGDLSPSVYEKGKFMKFKNNTQNQLHKVRADNVATIQKQA